MSGRDVCIGGKGREGTVRVGGEGGGKNSLPLATGCGHLNSILPSGITARFSSSHHVHGAPELGGVVTLEDPADGRDLHIKGRTKEEEEDEEDGTVWLVLVSMHAH